MIESSANVSRLPVDEEDGGFAERALELLLARDADICGLRI